MLKFGQLPNITSSHCKADWLIAPVVIEHDSGILTKTNYDYQLNYFKEVEHFTSRFGTDVQWFEVVVVAPEFQVLVENLAEKLKGTDCLDEQRYENLQDEAVQNIWNNMTIEERLKECKALKQRLSIFTARRKVVPMEVYCRLEARVKD